ncbi:MAG TPA: mucoidy inhibitor MuiA family protein [Ktedonobacteraceae bacterium]|jgi:uncharacterized protein (TIGR02231 family)|nr:mucoidy inhibitor MuiA family protein [Ktedonobacteraceae bacterium]
MTDLEAPITEVIVYADRALVTRRGGIHLAAGEHELRINNLPQLLRESVRASGQGPQGTRILNVDITTAFHSRPPEADLLTLQTEFELLQRKYELLGSRQDALRKRQKWLNALGEQAHDFARGLAWGRMKPQDCADFLGFMSNQAQQDAEAMLDLEVQRKQVEQDMAAKKRELASKQGTGLADRLAAIVSVALEQEGDFALELSYLVMGASWHPQYDVRVQMNDEGDGGEVELSYVGMVQQSTGERWENVSLALSTARPSLAAVLPELDPWYLNVYTPPPMPVRAQAARHMASMNRAASEGEGVFFAAAMPAAAGDGSIATTQALPAEITTATVEQSGPAYLFRVGRSVDIPSDNSPHKTTIARDNLPCTFDYVSAPAIEENAHLRATIINTTERVLLEGEASIFLSGDYVGTTRIKMTAPNEKFRVFLGIEDAIKVKRELIERAVDKGNLLQNDMRRITYAYRITVHNYTAFPRSIAVRDHLPVSQHERVKVRVQAIQPQPAERSKLEILKWRSTLPPGGEQKIEYRFTVEHPQDLKVIGLP